MKLSSVLTCAAGLALAVPAFASLPASDNADDVAYSGGWVGGTNGGTGWFPWVINVQQNNGAGNFAGSFWAGASNTDLQDIKSPNHAWGTYANGGGGIPAVAAYRRLTGDAFNTNNLVNGQTITILQENGGIGGGGFVGMTFGAFNLGATSPFAAGLTGAMNGQSLFGFFGGDSTYKIMDADGTLDTGIGWTNRGLAVSFTLINSNTGLYNMTVTELNGNIVHNYNNRHINGGIDSIGLYNYYANENDAFFNSVSIVPGPGSMALLGLGGLLAARRRR